MKNFMLAMTASLLLASCSQTQEPKDKELVDLSTVDNNIEKGILKDSIKIRLKRAGEILVSGDGIDNISAYFDTKAFKYHGPGCAEMNYEGLMNYFVSFRSAFDNRSIKRGLMLREGNYISCQTWIAGDFVHPFAKSPIGELKPNGKKVVNSITNVFRFDSKGRIVEEWVMGDNRSYLNLLSADTGN